ncbi:MAG TPA: DUF4845 domain-containing protein, partial [Candidatus Krumholzibacteria bacterium]|nr:DUF4845 domain-containing protein [Candidatus Krumholzibacteria bacterium]
EDPRAADWDKAKLIREMNNILYIDYGADIIDLHDALTLEKTDTHSYIKVKYDVTVPLVYNLSALVNFNDQAEIVR